MTEAERREVRRAKTLLQAGDRTSALASLRRLETVTKRALFLSPQMIFRFVVVHCETLGGDVPAHVCVARQVASDAQRTTDVERGQVSDYPSCVTERCAQGRAVREALAERIAWRGAGPNGRFERSRSDAEAQRRARQRADVAGRLDDVPTMDRPPIEGEE